MCNYELLAVDEGVADEDVLAQADHAMRTLGDLSQYPYLLLTSQGSFLDDEEINGALRSKLLRKFWDAGLRAISTESEARYCVDDTRLSAMRIAFPGQISIGIGFEAADEFVRNSIINKGLPLHMLVRASEVIAANGCAFYTYISLGKPFLSWEEDIADAAAAIRQSIQLGAFMSVVEMINIQPHTLTERLWKVGKYEPCNLWRGSDLLDRLTEAERQVVSIKGYDADISPVPLSLPKSCDQCDTRMREGLSAWNLNRAYQEFRARIGACSCHRVPVGDIDLETIPLEVRVRDAIASLQLRSIATPEVKST
jgi:radical SAM enzyme (TIGR01210 family)